MVYCMIQLFLRHKSHEKLSKTPKSNEVSYHRCVYLTNQCLMRQRWSFAIRKMTNSLILVIVSCYCFLLCFLLYFFSCLLICFLLCCFDSCVPCWWVPDEVAVVIRFTQTDQNAPSLHLLLQISLCIRGPPQQVLREAYQLFNKPNLITFNSLLLLLLHIIYANITI